MRRAVVSLLAASSLAGCNLVFGLDQTQGIPDAGPVDAAGMAIHLGFLQLEITASGAPAPPHELPFTDLVRVEAATLDGARTEPLTAVDGTLRIPLEFAAGSWRLIYQRANDVVRELQNLPADAHVIEPLYGPLARTTPAAGSGYTIIPSGYSGSHALNRVFTTGTWTEGTQTAPAGGAAMDYNFSEATSLDGPLGTPGVNDRAVLVDFRSASGCRTSTGSTDFAASPIGPPKTTVGGGWAPVATLPDVTTSLNLITTQDIRPLGEVPATVIERFGYLPTTAMPELTRGPDPDRFLLLRNPPLLTIRSCTLPYAGPAPVLEEPTYFKDHLVRAVHTEITSSRHLAAGPTLINGLAIVTTDHGGVFPVTTDVAFPRNVTLTSEDLTRFDLFGTSERVPVLPGTGPLTLSWDTLTPGSIAQFWEIALIEVQGSGLTTRRVYVTTSMSLTIQRGDLAPGREYVFALTAFSGRIGAVAGDFRLVSPDQAISVTHTRTILAP